MIEKEAVYLEERLNREEGILQRGPCSKRGGGGIIYREVIREGDLLDRSRVALIIMMIIMK